MFKILWKCLIFIRTLYFSLQHFTFNYKPTHGAKDTMCKSMQISHLVIQSWKPTVLCLQQAAHRDACVQRLRCRRKKRLDHRQYFYTHTYTKTIIKHVQTLDVDRKSLKLWEQHSCLRWYHGYKRIKSLYAFFMYYLTGISTVHLTVSL